jgi:O-antigen/teichoic acid export membrane protein
MLLLMAITAPACLLLALLSTPLIAVVYGQQWVPAAPALSLLVVLGLTRVLGELSYDFLVALGRTRPNLAIQALWCAALVPVLPIGAHLGGFEGVAWGHAAVAVGVVLPAYAVVLRREGVRPVAVVAAAARPGLGLCLCAAAVTAVVSIVPGSFLDLALGGAVGLLVYAAVVFPMRRLVRSGLSPAGQDLIDTDTNRT